jgi:hypothetical protein
MGGLGKTTLAVHVAHRLTDRYSDGQIVVDMAGTSTVPLSPAQGLARVIPGRWRAGRYSAQFLQRLALDAGNSAAHQSARLAHLDHHHQGRDRIKRGQASAEIIDLGHGVTSISSYGREGATTSAARPIASLGQDIN